MPLKTIRLELARHPDHPEGSSRHGYELQAPLQADGHLDEAAWHSLHRTVQMPVRRFWSGDDDRSGELVHTRHGWAFSYAPRSEEHTSELQSLMRISYAVFCLKKKNNNKQVQICKQIQIKYEDKYDHTIDH